MPNYGMLLLVWGTYGSIVGKHRYNGITLILEQVYLALHQVPIKSAYFSFLAESLGWVVWLSCESLLLKEWAPGKVSVGVWHHMSWLSLQSQIPPS